MSATVTKSEEREISQLCDMKEPFILRNNPVTKNHMFFKLRRPPSVNGFRGKGDGKPSTLDLLRILVLDNFIELIKSGGEPKISMIFVKSFDELNTVNGFLLTKEHF